MLMPIENCASDAGGIETSTPVRRAPKKNRTPKVLIRTSCPDLICPSSYINEVACGAKQVDRPFILPTTRNPGHALT